jgi:hypothetical protein
MPAARGSLLKYESSPSPSTFTTIPGIGDFSFSLGEKELYEEDSQDTTASIHKATGKTINKPITVPIDVYDATNTHHAAMVTALGATTEVKFKIVSKNGKTYDFGGQVTEIVPDHKKSGGTSAAMTIQPSGAIVIS